MLQIAFYCVFNSTLNNARPQVLPILTGDNSPPATTHEAKCNTLHKHLFPKPPSLPEEPLIDLSPKPDDIKYALVTKREVQDAIFTAAQLNAPGISGLTGQAWRWGWEVLHEEIFNLLRLAADSGYHPMTWRTSIAVAIQKPNQDYSLPWSYRLIQLLEVIGKALECTLHSQGWDLIRLQNTACKPPFLGPYNTGAPIGVLGPPT